MIEKNNTQEKKVERLNGTFSIAVTKEMKDAFENACADRDERVNPRLMKFIKKSIGVDNDSSFCKFMIETHIEPFIKQSKNIKK